MHGLRLRFQWLFLLLALLAVAPNLHAHDYEVGDVIKVKILKVHPTQFSIGMKEVEIRMLKLEEKEEEGKLKKYKKKHPGSVVVGPDEELYLIDGHHLARALDDYGKVSMRVEVVADYSDLSPDEFWAKLKRKHYCYLKDQNGKPNSPDDLPRTVRGLKDDPYRSLAWLLRHSDGYEKVETPFFQEFYWAQYLRRHIEPWDDDYDGWKHALKKAMKLAESENASGLPGWTGGTGDCSEMLEKLGETEN